MRRWLGVLVVGMLLPLMPITAASAANANCGTAGTNNARFFLGYKVYPLDYPQQEAYINEADADMDREPAAFCTSQPGGTAFWWVTIAGTGCCGIAQIGLNHLLDGDDPGYNFFYYWKDKDGNPGRDTWGSPVDGVFHNFEILRIDDSNRCDTNGHHCLAFLLDNSFCYVNLGRTFCPVNNWDPHNITDPQYNGTHAWFSSEILYAGQDVPGTPGNLPDSAAHFKGIEEQDGPTFHVHNPWDLLFTCSADLTWFKHKVPDGGVNKHFYIYTQPIDNHGYTCSA